ncbi:MAG: Purine nucleoside phosphoramidase [Firmicutes bacterium]|nr:Purine nucleoside phosphoramidase [Bacillota bacterium]
MQHDCIFCKIVNRDIPAKIIYEDEYVIAFPDVSPAAPVHILVIPKRHIPNLTEVSPEDAALMGHIMTTIPKIAAEAGLADNGFRTVINTKDDGGQTVHHLHCHVLGGRFMKWPPG